MIINIGGEYFLGIMAALMGIAWYSGSRFTALETSMGWVKNILHDLKIDSENASNPAFGHHSPVSLNATGDSWLAQSGMKEYLDSNKDEILNICEEKRSTNPYEVQNYIFRYFDTMDFESDFEDRLKKFAYEKGTTMSMIRRVGGIYFRDICINHFGMNREDIDKHDPAKPKTT